jgi:hypothetical protein
MSQDELTVTIELPDVEVSVEEIQDIETSVEINPDVIVVVAGNLGPPGIQGPPGVGTFRTGRTWAIAGDLSQAPAVIPPIFVPEATGENTTLISMRAALLSGTSVMIQMQKNGADIGAPFVVTTTPVSIQFSESIVDLDMLGWTRSSLVGNPSGLSLTAIFEHIA